MTMYLGDYPVNGTVHLKFSTNAAAGSRVAFSSALETADIRVYKGGSDTQRSSEAGYTVTSAFDSLVGVHHVTIDLSDNTDAGFYAAGNEYQIVLYPDETVDSLAVAAVLGHFSIERSGGILALLKDSTFGLSALETLVDGVESTLGTPAGASISADIAAIEAQTDDIGAAGAGLSAVPWNAAWDAEVQSEVADALAVYDPPTHAELQTEINDVQADTEDIQARLPAALTAGGNIKADVLAISGDATAADNLEAYTDGTTKMPVNVEEVNNTQLQGVGTSGDPWRPA